MVVGNLWEPIYMQSQFCLSQRRVLSFLCFQANDKGLNHPAKSQKTKQKVFLTKEIHYQQKTPGRLARNLYGSQVLGLSSFFHRHWLVVSALGRGGGELAGKRVPLDSFLSFLQARKSQGTCGCSEVGSSLWASEAQI